MKDIPSLILFIATGLSATGLFAEELDNTTADTVGQAENYLEEIKASCEQEAVGLADADDYVKNCIEIMKENFSN